MYKQAKRMSLVKQSGEVRPDCLTELNKVCQHTDCPTELNRLCQHIDCPTELNRLCQYTAFPTELNKLCQHTDCPTELNKLCQHLFYTDWSYLLFHSFISVVKSYSVVDFDV